MKKAVYNSKKEQTKSRRKPGRKFQEENFRKKISGRDLQRG